MRDIVFLFGAGASFGAGSILPEPPPLGWQLYGRLAHLFPASWGQLPWHITAVFSSGDFESAMRMVYDELGMDIPQLMRDMAVFFVQYRPVDRSTLYCRLIRELAANALLPRTLFSTLNYECVLEYSLLEHGFGVDYFGDGTNEAPPVWKLHGSCNMFAHGIAASPGVAYSPGVVFDAGVQAFLDRSRVIEECLVRTALAPVMSLYMEGKPLAIGPSAIADLQTRWATAVSTADTVVCIGVRPWPIDTHIWGPIAATRATLLIAGDEQAMNAWITSSGRKGPSTFLGSRFNLAYPSLIQSLKELCS